MRNILICSLGLLFACAGPSGNYSLGSDGYLDSPAERAAAKREANMLSDLADEGIFPEERATQVTVKYHRSGTTIGLYNEANVSQSDYYTTSRTDADYKVVPNIEMGALLMALEDLGYFGEALVGIKRVSGASMSIVIRRGSESWTLSWGPSMGETNHELTQDCADAIGIMFNTTRSVQVVDNPDGSDFFQRERDRIQRENSKHGSSQRHN